MRFTDLLILLILAAIWGASFLFMRISAPEFGPIPLIAFRMSIAGLVLTPVFFKKEARLIARRYWLQLLISGIFGSGLSFILISYATLTLTAGFTSLMNSSVPIFSAILTASLLGERLRRPQIIGLILGILGTVILVWGKLDFRQNGHGWPIIACLTSCFFYGFGATWAKSKLHAIPPLIASAGSLSGAALILIPIALTSLPETNPSLLSWLSALALALICTALAFILFFRLIRHSSATVATSVTFLIPFFAIFWGGLFLDEKITPNMIAGLIVSLLGTALITEILGKPKLQI